MSRLKGGTLQSETGMYAAAGNQGNYFTESEGLWSPAPKRMGVIELGAGVCPLVRLTVVKVLTVAITCSGGHVDPHGLFFASKHG